MKKALIVSCVFLGIVATVFGIEKRTSNIPRAKEISDSETIELKTLDLDGFRYIKELHKDVKVHVFWNNGVYGKGLMLSFFGELNSKVHNVKNIIAKKVILEDGTQLTRKQIREHRHSIMLGNDHKSLGFRVDLDTHRITNIKHISGEFEVTKAVGSIEVTSDLLQDKSNSKENKIGININMASNWMGGRYYVLIIENAENIVELTVLDQNGNELKQTYPFSIFGVENDHVKIYVDKKKGVPFAIKLKRAERLQVRPIPFVLENINLMTY